MNYEILSGCRKQRGQFGKEINTPEVALIRLQAGMELGLSPIWSLVNIFVIAGRPTVYGDALLGIVRAHRDFADIRETLQGEGDDMVAICEIDRKGQSTTARRFSVKDASAPGFGVRADRGRVIRRGCCRCGREPGRVAMLSRMRCAAWE